MDQILHHFHFYNSEKSLEVGQSNLLTRCWFLTQYIIIGLDKSTSVAGMKKESECMKEGDYLIY